MMNVLELTNVHRSYEKGVEVVRGVDLAIAPGEVVGLLGANGAGKTTLIRIAMGMLFPQEGSVRLFGVDPREDPVGVKRRIGYVSEDQVLPPYLRVAGVLELFRSLYPSWDAELERELVQRFELDPRARIAKLSKGQARRVAVVCAVAHRPELLILDEPAGGLDPAARREVLEAALRLLGDAGSAILFSSHHMTDVERLARRIVLVHEGRKLVDRDLDELREEHTLAVLPDSNGLTPERLRSLEGCVAARRHVDELRAVFAEGVDGTRGRLAAAAPGHAPHCRTLPLEELFVELVGGQR